MKDFRQDVNFQAGACAPKAKLVAQTVPYTDSMASVSEVCQFRGEEQIRN